MEEALKLIQHLCETAIGLNTNSISAKTWQRALLHRMQQTGSVDNAAYFKLLQQSSLEQQKLFELLIVNESWFFRDKSAFEFMVEACHRLGKTPLRLLSLPCASGEEPYSMAMALLDGGFAIHQFHIDAVDINKSALVAARQGLYRENAFRGKALVHCAKYFTHKEQLYEVSETVRQRVHFSYGNAINFENRLSYHIIFCRNLLIYLHPKAREAVLANMKLWLVPQGILFVGPAEIDIAHRHGFNSIGPMRASALRV